LPDGIFSNQKSRFGQFFEDLTMEDVGIFYGHLVYFKAICYTLWKFGMFCGTLVNFSTFWYVVPRKLWQPCSGDQRFLFIARDELDLLFEIQFFSTKN
jgi:hypothetical protein